MVVTFNNFLRFSQKCTYHTSLFPAEVSVPFEASTLLPEFSIAICIKEHCNSEDPLICKK